MSVLVLEFISAFLSLFISFPVHLLLLLTLSLFRVPACIPPAVSGIPCSISSDAAVDEKFALAKTPPLDQLLHVNVCLAKDPSDFYVHISDRPDKPISEWAVTKLAKDVDTFYRDVAAKNDSVYWVTDR